MENVSPSEKQAKANSQIYRAETRPGTIDAEGRGGKVGSGLRGGDVGADEGAMVSYLIWVKIEGRQEIQRINGRNGRMVTTLDRALLMQRGEGGGKVVLGSKRGNVGAVVMNLT